MPHWAKDVQGATQIGRKTYNARSETVAGKPSYRWINAGTGEVVTSFTMLTVNADSHPVMGWFGRPGDEKRSVVVLEPGQFGTWLGADTVQAGQAMVRPAVGLLAAGVAAMDAQVAQAGLF